MLWTEPIKSTLGGFSANCLERVVFATYKSYMPDSRSMCNDFDLQVIYIGAPDKFYIVRMYITRASNIEIAMLSYGALYFDDLFIDDVSGRQMEGVKYHFADEGGNFSFYCNEVEVKSIHEYENDSLGRQLWPPDASAGGRPT
ncbi:hypothetical protein Mal52_00360 [Symmachiella dynata]|uniref:Uncharacterized protein n=1 Tax=Symmachiella dynata TaxID=2527995 RepID=A0A517ZGG7_9PLAN|nr:hypothetical protein [Symmachiella dynata]QDU41583.1 hypothetical protein Mal52_00360 [Symmachiella dynata]